MKKSKIIKLNGLELSTGGLVSATVDFKNPVDISNVMMELRIHAGKLGFSSINILPKKLGEKRVLLRYESDFTHPVNLRSVIIHYEAEERETAKLVNFIVNSID